MPALPSTTLSRSFSSLFAQLAVLFFLFISNLMQAEMSAVSCSTAQCKTHFWFLGCTYIQYGILTAVVILIIAIILRCSAEAAKVGSQSHVNASRSPLTGHSISPEMSHAAAQSLLDYKGGNWLFSYHRDDVLVHTVSLPTADRDFCPDWCLDPGAACHFCTDSTKFMSI